MYGGILPLVAIVAVGAVFYMLGRNAVAKQGSSEEELETLRRMLNDRLMEQTERLVETIGRSREESRMAIGQGFGETQKNISESFSRDRKEITDTLGKTQDILTERLENLIKQTAEMKGASDNMLKIGGDIRNLSQILEGPKGRGDFGEFQLEMLLSQVVPTDRYALQYTIGEGKVDAAVLLKDCVLCIDSKFPLANLQKYHDMKEPSPERERLLAAFYADVKNRGKEISKKYIVPPKTLDFAIMFIPAEGVFIEVVSNRDLHAALMEMKVIPASPNFLYVYFQAITIGFRGIAVEAQAKEIIDVLSELKGSFNKFQDSFLKLGKHISNASAQYAESEKQSARISQTLDNLRLGQPASPTLPPPENRD